MTALKVPRPSKTRPGWRARLARRSPPEVVERLSFERIRAANVERCNAVFFPLSSWSPLEYGGALAGEVGELCNVLKKMRRDGVTPNLMKKAEKEAADALAYLDLTCARLGIDLEKAYRKKFNEVSRKNGSTVLL